MPRSSRHKSHKQSKHGSKDAREYSDSEEDVKMKDRNGEEGSVRVSKDSASAEKRKVASQLRDGKDLSTHGNGDTAEEYVASKRRKEKADGAAASDRWNGGGGERGDGITIDKETKGESSRIESDKGSKSKVLVDSKSKTIRKHESFIEKKEENLAAEKEESKSSSRVDSKRKSEKDSGGKEVHQHKDSKESKEKERGPERERKGQEIKRDAESRSVDGEVARKQGSQSVDFSEERQGKQIKENTDWPIQEDLRNPDGEKELEKGTRKRRDGSSDKDKYQDHVRESDDRQLSSRGERVKDGRYKDERHKDGSSGDKHREDGDRDDRHRENKYRDDGDRDNRHKEDKYREDSVRDNRRRDDKYRGKYREDGDRDNRHRDDKYREEGDRVNRHKDDKYRDDGDRDNRHGDDKYWKDADKDNRNSEDKHREDVDRDNRRRDGKQREDFDRDKRLRDVKYRDEHSSRDRNDKSDAKRLRDEINAGEHYKKSTNHDGSPIHDDQRNSNKDDKGKRRAGDKEDHSDMRSRSNKEQRSDTEKKSSAKVASITDRGRSYSRNADVEITPTRSRRRSSPSSSSHAGKDHYRLSKLEGSRNRDYVHEERIRHDVNSSKEFIGVAGVTEKVSASWSMEKSVLKDDSHLSDFSTERRQKSDSRTSPLQLVDKSPSSSSNDRRHLNKSDARRSLDVEESGQRSGGSRDARDYSDKEGRGSRELPMETHLVDEFSQADADTLSVSSPFSRTNRLSSNSKSLLPPPPPPFRTGVDNPLIFGSSEDDSRGRPNNRNRRVGDSGMGRVQGNAWKGVPNWPSPVANGFIPFQHGPPPVGFHPVMQQFPAPPMFSVRPSMELNHTGVPYHIPDADRFSGHGRPLGWRNPVDDSCPPPLHGWDANNAIFGDESHIYLRPDWDHNRTLSSGRGWEASGEMWKGQNGGVSTELPSASQKQDYSAHGSADEVWMSQSVNQAQNEQKQMGLRVESLDVSKSSDGLASNAIEASKTVPKGTTNISKLPRKDDDHLWHVYLSKLDISADLTHPELYDQCTSLMDINQNLDSDKDDSKILFVEEVAGADVAISNKNSRASLFATTNDSVFQKAMSLYKKEREEIRAINGEKVPLSTVENLEFVATTDHEKVVSIDDKPGELVPSCEQLEEEGAVSNSIQEKAELPITFQKLEVSPETLSQKAGEPISPTSLEKSEEPISTLETVKMEIDPVPNQETMEHIVEDKSLALGNLERSDSHPHIKVEDVNQASDSRGNNSANSNKEQNLVDIKCGTLLFSDVSSEACEPVMPESIECGSVNLSRIHHSPESTH